jgi:hypothetical protein
MQSMGFVKYRYLIFGILGAALGQPLIGWYLDTMGSTGGHYSLDAYSVVLVVF